MRLLADHAELACRWQEGLAHFGTAAHGAAVATLKHSRELVELMGHSAQAKVGLARQAITAANAPSLLGSQARWLSVWVDAMRLAQSNAGALTEINSRAMSSWLRLAGNHTLKQQGSAA